MSRDDITRMAREAGVYAAHTELTLMAGLERFAALVAAAERERIIAQNAPEIEKINEHIKALEEAATRAVERAHGIKERA